MSIPPFNDQHVLPPYTDDPIDPSHMSPYSSTTVELCHFFATFQERIDILRGLLAFRAMLRQIGFSNGYQWLDGSFVEEIEKVENRLPRNIDVVTFFRMPSHLSLHDLRVHHPMLADHALIKTTDRVDHYFVDVSLDGLRLAMHVRYWFGLFSHRRDRVWKGRISVPLSSENDDREALQTLEVRKDNGRK